MTNKEAVNEICDMANALQIMYKSKQGQALQMAIESLENQKTGHWVKDEMSIMFTIWECSECGGGGDKHFKYCPNCGAKMEGVNDE